MADLSTQGAIEALTALEEPEENTNDTPDPAKAADDGADEQDQPEAEASDASEEGDDGPEEATDDAEEGGKDEPAQPALDPPQFLDADERETFKALPREAQEILARHDKALVADYTRKTQQVAATRKATEQSLAQITSAKQGLDTILAAKADVVKQWRDVDWAEVARNSTEEEYAAYQARHRAAEDDYAQLFQAVSGATSKAAEISSQQETETFNTHVAEQKAKLEEFAPHLLAPETGPKRMQEIFSYLESIGTPERIKWVSAEELSLVDDALQWRAHKASAAKKPVLKPVQDAKSKGRALRPTGAQPPQQQRGKAVRRFEQTRSIQDAMSAIADMDD